MRRNHPASGVRVIGAAVLLAQATLARPASPSDVLGTNVRPFFAVGPSVPIGLDGGRTGYGMAFGFEAEQSPRASVLFRLEWHRMGRRPTANPDPYYFYDSYADDFRVINWSLGGRVHLRPGARYRPYGEACLGVRLGDGTSGGGIGFAGSSRDADFLGEGLAVTLRLGLSSAAAGRAGFFLDSGLDFLAEEPDRYGIVPVRLGVVFP